MYLGSRYYEDRINTREGAPRKKTDRECRLSVTHLLIPMTHSRHVMSIPSPPGSAPSPPLSSSPSLHRYHPSSAIMKSFTLLTASALLGAASAEVHKLKLNKIPLEEQLVMSVSRAIMVMRL